MRTALTVNGGSWPRALSFVSGAGMIAASVLTIRHFFLANFPSSIFQGSFCDINAFFNCDSSAFSVISQIGGVPLGYFGLVVGVLVALGAVFASEAMERTNKTIALVNAIGVVALFCFSVFSLKSLCLLCSGYYVFGLVSFFLFWRYGIDQDQPGVFRRYFHFSWRHAATYAVVTAAGAYFFVLFHQAKVEAQSGGPAARVVKEYYSLPRVASPSLVSPFMTAKATERFEDAPIQVIEYADFLCSDCLYLHQQLVKLEKEFKGKINVAFQFFPLEAACNTVVAKNLHPGASEISYMAAYDPQKFAAMHDEIFANFRAARTPGWRHALAKKYGVEAAVTDVRTKELVQRIIRTGAEYEKTSDKFAHGIRSTPTMILNNRMVIGTLPYPQLRAIFQALVEEHERGQPKRFIEKWMPTR